MKCSQCHYLHYTQAESNEMTCAVFGDDIPEKYERNDGEGCRCTRKQLEKFYKQNEEAWLQDAGDFVRFCVDNGYVSEDFANQVKEQDWYKEGK